MTPRARKRFEREVQRMALQLYRSAFNALAIALRYGHSHRDGPELSHHPKTTPAYRAALLLLQDAGVLGEPLPQSSKWASIRYPVLWVLPEHEAALMHAAYGGGLALYQVLAQLPWRADETACASAT